MSVAMAAAHFETNEFAFHVNYYIGNDHNQANNVDEFSQFTHDFVMNQKTEL